MNKEEHKPVIEDMEKVSDGKELVLYNDEFNTFDYVIEALIDVLGHDAHQAEQCAWIAHLKGKCTVKSGSFTELKPSWEEMTRRELTVEIQ